MADSKENYLLGERSPFLVVLAGLPGTGKTTLARMLSKEFNLLFLRADSVEAPFMAQNEICGSCGEGYQALVNLAEENLALGHSVIIDCVNPIHNSRKMFLDFAQRTNTLIFQFEVKMQDLNLHRKRVEERKADIPSQRIPSWNDVLTYDYDLWDEIKDGAVKIVWSDDIKQAFVSCLNTIKNG